MSEIWKHARVLRGLYRRLAAALGESGCPRIATFRLGVGWLDETGAAAAHRRSRPRR